jgi:transposase
VTSVPWPAMNPDLNPVEHIWDMLGRRIQAREPPVQNIRQWILRHVLKFQPRRAKHHAKRVRRCQSANSRAFNDSP